MLLKKTLFFLILLFTSFITVWLYLTDLSPLSIFLPKNIQAPIGKPLPSNENILHKIVFGSCNDQNMPMNIWGPIIAEKPDIMALIGDNVYGNSLINKNSVSRLKKAYYTLSKRPEFKVAQQKIPIISIWDDGDYGITDGGANSLIKQRSKSLFLDFWNIPEHDPRHKREGLYQSWIFGDKGKRIQIILLDTRSFKTPWRPTDHKQIGKERYIPSLGTQNNILGNLQWKWLGDQLSKPAELRFIISSIQIIADSHGYESWKLFPHQRSKLYKLIDEIGAKGVVFISGDRHIGAFYEKKGVTGYPLYEMTTSSLNKPKKSNGKEMGSHQLGSVFTGENYGIIEIDWETKSLDLKLKDLHGSIVKQKKIVFPGL